MRALFVSPRSTFMARNKRFTRMWETAGNVGDYRRYWSGIGSSLPLLAALSPVGMEPVIVDENVEQIEFDAEGDAVFITAMTQQADRAYAIADEFRRRGKPTVIGGMHATTVPHEAAMHADAVVVGEAESIWAQLIEHLTAGRLMPFYRADDPVDLSALPVPRYDLLAGKGYNIVWIQTTRGCPHDCDFCAASNIYGRTYRRKEIAQVVEEVITARNALGDVHIGFADDNLLACRPYAESLLEALVPLGIRHYLQADITFAADDKLLELLRRSGCAHVFIGYESMRDCSIGKYWKSRFVHRYPELTERIQSAGIGVFGSFIFGLDGDDLSTIDEIVAFVAETNLYCTQVCILTPLPGTRLRERLLAEGRVLATPWSNYTMFDVNIRHPRLTTSQLENGVVEAYRRIYSADSHRKKMDYFRSVRRRLLCSPKVG